jgi:HSP20 family protein
MFYPLVTRPAHGYQRRYAPVISDAALDGFLKETFDALAGQAKPQSATVEDQEKAYSVQLDVPGLAREQLEVGIEADVVRVSSKADAPRQVKAAWRFPLEIDADQSTAKLEHGVLTLTLGKKSPVSNVAQVTIQ